MTWQLAIGLWLAGALACIASLAYRDDLEWRTDLALALGWPVAFWAWLWMHLGDRVRARVADKERRILCYLKEHGPSFGLALVRAGLSSRGSIYITLSSMEDRTLVESSVDPEDEYKRRKYRITDFGAESVR